MRIIVFMIASHGVAQPHVWNYWKECGLEDIEIIFRVHSFRRVEHGKVFCERHRIRDERSEKIYMDESTRWGSFRLLYETLMAMWYINNEFRDRPYRLMIVSGTDIPICGIQQWLRENSPILNYVGMQDNMVHSQWMTLDSKIINTIFQRLSFHDKRTRYDKLITMFTLINVFLQDDYYSMIAPDEVWLNFIGFTRREMDAYFSSSHIVLPFYRLLDSPVSPIEWIDFQKEEYIQRTVNTKWFTLKQALLFTSRRRSSQPSILFFRKIMSSVRIPRLFLKRLYQQDETEQDTDTSARDFDVQSQFSDKLLQMLQEQKHAHDKKQSQGRRNRKKQYQSSFSFVPRPATHTPKHTIQKHTQPVSKYLFPIHLSPTDTKPSRTK